MVWRESSRFVPKLLGVCMHHCFEISSLVIVVLEAKMLGVFLVGFAVMHTDPQPPPPQAPKVLEKGDLTSNSGKIKILFWVSLPYSLQRVIFNIYQKDQKLSIYPSLICIIFINFSQS